MTSNFDVTETNTLHLLSVFLSSYITEDELNKEIKVTDELTLLRILLEIKLNLIQLQRHSSFSYHLDVLLSKFPKRSNEVCSIIELALQIQSDVSQYLSLLNYIACHLSSAESYDIIPHLKLLNVALSQSVHERERSVLLLFIESYNFDYVIDGLLDIDDKTAIHYLTVNILPKYFSLNTNCTNKTRNFIWKRSLQSQTLDIICAIPNFFLDYSSLGSNSFWNVLQNCLGSSNHIVQKQALFLLKETLNCVEKFPTTIAIVSCKNDSQYDTDSAWCNLFILYEVAREKQLHLIEPAYKLLPTIKILHSSWLISIYKIFLNHSHNAVRSYIIIDLLNSDWFNDLETFEQMVSPLLFSINKIEFTTNEKIWESFENFINGIDESKLKIVVAESAKIRWVPPICYLFYSNILSSNISLSTPLIEEVISNIKNLPHRTIRNECLELVGNFVALTCKELDFDNFIHLNWLLYRDLKLLKSTGLEVYRANIENVFNLWQQDHVDLRYVPLILKIVRTLGNEHIENLLSLFKLGKLHPQIADQLCTWCSVKELNTVVYIKDRLSNITETNSLDLKYISSLLEFDHLNYLIDSCNDILLNHLSNQSQIEIAFEIANTWAERGGNVELFDEVLDKWSEKFLNKLTTTGRVCCNFIRLYGRRRLATAINLDTLLKTIELFEQMMDTQDSSVVSEIFHQLDRLLGFSEIVEPLLRFLDFCVQKLKELKGSDLFKVSVCNIVTSIILNGTVSHGNVSILEKSCGILWSLLELANSCEDIAYSLSENLYKLSVISPNVTPYFIPLIVELLLFGEILQKDHRAEYVVCQLIFAAKPENNPNRQKIEIRALPVKCIQNLLKGKQREESADAIASLLLQKYSKHFNKRYFSDSQIHLSKLRILQGLLLVHNDMKKQKQAVIDMLLNSLCNESHQISVKFFIIWLLIRLLSNNEGSFQTITTAMEKTCKVHTSTIIAFIPILYHIVLLRNEDTLFSKLFETLLPWTMGAHFNLRLYAQVGIVKLYKVSEKREYHAICKKYKHIMDCISEVLNKTERKIDIIDEFIFNVFDPCTDYNLEMIYYGIPHITHVTCDEYENVTYLCNRNSRHSIDDLNEWRSSRIKSIKNIKEDVCTNTIQKK
ncbi:hypothetical protein RI129_001725 [Pyrocoelia pectoralis]|uniref:Uncharacterized protein n=1 Tax=Pyrocoelia pectoralis TaxID=417401 RepID=A0AAN7VUH6_9COLE